MTNKTDHKDETWKIKIERIRRSKLWAADMAIVALRVLDYLEENNKSQRWLADRLGVSPQQITKIVKGRQNMSWGKLKELESVLGISLVSIADNKASYKAPIYDNAMVAAEEDSTYGEKI